MPAQPAPPIRRQTHERWLGGVSAGLAEHFGTEVTLIRLLFVATGLLGGLGVLAYALMWLVFPLSADESTPGTTTRSWDLSGLLGLVSATIGALLILRLLGFPVEVSIWAPLLLLAAGIAVIWVQSDEAGLAVRRARAVAGVDRRTGAFRLLVGVGLLAVGAVALLIPRLDLLAAVQLLLALAAVAGGVAVIGLPWLSGWLRERQLERASAIRAEERAMMAARVHDSVLQTLALIQLRSDDAAEVVRLARTEERALRAWLYDPGPRPGTFVGALRAAIHSVEADYSCRVELVTVGDSPLDGRLEALVAATREAVVNAAKHSGAPPSVYAEVSRPTVEVNVLDRGRGFDPEAVDQDRHGLRQSVVNRIGALGGSALVRSSPGSGTEIRLTLPMEEQR